MNYDQLRKITIPAIVIWPLRLFLGFTFVWASFNKLLDPTFLDPASPNSIGSQIAAIQASSPIGGLLASVILPNATLFGMLVMAGELLIGIAVLLGWFTRFSALMGLLINLSFYLTITWDVHPFFLGSDIVFIFAWLTLLLAGPGPLSMDEVLHRRWAAPVPPAVPLRGKNRPAQPVAADPELISRRRFTGIAAAAAAALALGLIDMGAWPLLHARGTRNGAGSSPPPTDTAAAQAPNPGNTAVAQAPNPTDTAVAQSLDPQLPTPAPQPPARGLPFATPGLPPDAAATLTAEPTPLPPTDVPTPAPGGALIAAANQLQAGSALAFDNPQTGDPNVLVRLPTGYVAYSAVCTHAGCTVRYLASQGLLACPCHGSRFDPAQNAQPLGGPARRPLPPVNISVHPDGSVYLP
ncbi:MAG: TQO small subunit DoxD [Chloroflexia bacterium]